MKDLTNGKECVIINTERKKEVIEMLKFTVVHKYCGYTKTVEGHNVWEALRKNNLDPTVWIVQSIGQ